MPAGAIYVGRPSLWGNPYPVNEIRGMFPHQSREEALRTSLRLYREELTHWGMSSDYAHVVSEARWERHSAAITQTGARNLGEYAAIVLRGKDLACWCPLDQPCHADVLLELAS